ncbi:MAG: ComF family protein [candidate division WOR-3 bacterium]
MELKKLVKYIAENLNYFIDFILPSSCIICGKEIERYLVCDNCLDLILYPKSPLCPNCGRPINDTKTCRFCRYEKTLDYGRAFTLYVPPVDVMIHHLKYRGKTQLANFFGMGMSGVLKNDFYLRDADHLVPVPLFWWKKLRRTYNQAELLSKIISQETTISVLDCLIRIKNTRTQTRLDHKKRQDNVRNAFRLKKEFSVKDKKIIIIDDVMTTGATIKECARVLKDNGAKEVYSLVGAITP